MRVHHSQALGSTTTICLPAVGWPVTLPASQQVHSNPAATTRCCLTLQKVQRRLSHTGHNDGAHRSAMGNNAKSNIASANPQSAHTLSLSTWHPITINQVFGNAMMHVRWGVCGRVAAIHNSASRSQCISNAPGFVQHFYCRVKFCTTDAVQRRFNMLRTTWRHWQLPRLPDQFTIFKPSAAPGIQKLICWLRAGTMMTLAK